MAGGASHAPRRKSFPGVAMAMRIRSPCWSTAAHTAAMTTARAYGCFVASLSFVGCRSWTPSSVAMLQLLCFPDPLTSLNGFSCSRAARPWRAATSSMICMTMRFWSTWVVFSPKRGANSYWLGAT